MRRKNLFTSFGPALLVLFIALSLASAQQPETAPSKVYVPYEKLKEVFESEVQGVFLPYKEFEQLWRAAQGAPAGAKEAPMPYLISTARFSGEVGTDLASMHLELTMDILTDGWTEVPIGLGEVAVSKVEFTEQSGMNVKPLLRVVDGKYMLLTKGIGRRVLRIDFVRQLVTEPGLQVLSYRMPQAAITTLELLIPEENMKVDVEPMLAATTSQVSRDGKKATKLQAFLGSAERVKLRWKPRTQAAADLKPVVICEQLQHIHVSEALISHDVKFTYDIRRRGIDSLTIELPSDFRLTAVEGPNIAKWDIESDDLPAGKSAPQILKVELFSPAKDRYELTVKMERFLKESEIQIPLSPIVTQQVLRRTGLVAISHSPRRSAELLNLKNLARVDTGRLPENLRPRPGVTAYRFITADYGAAMAISTVDPRITVQQLWALGVVSDQVELRGRLNYTVERTGVFELKINFPEPWEILSVGTIHPGTDPGSNQALRSKLQRQIREVRFSNHPFKNVVQFMQNVSGLRIRVDWKALKTAGIHKSSKVNVNLTGVTFERGLRVILEGLGGTSPIGFVVDEGVIAISTKDAFAIMGGGASGIVEDYELTGSGDSRILKILLRKELTGPFHIDIIARQPRAEADEDLDFVLPLADPANLRLYKGQLVLMLANQLRGEVAELRQFQAMPLSQTDKWTSLSGLAPAMAFEFRTIDHDKPAGAKFRIAVKPTQVSAVVNHLVNVQPGSIEQEALIDYRILYAPVEALYLRMPASLADAGAQIIGRDIKEKPRIDELPADQRGEEAIATPPDVKWAYYKIVPQSPVIGAYRLTVRTRKSFQAPEVGGEVQVTVGPILAAGRLSDQSGHVAIAKSDMLTVLEPVIKGLTEADPSSKSDLPYKPHRKLAALAFKYSAPPFELAFSVITQKEAAVITTIVTGAIMEQVLARDGTLNTHATFLLQTRRGDRLPITLPAGAKIFSVLMNGEEAPVESGASANQRIVRLPPSAGQVAKIVLELSYSLDKARSRKLPAPELPDEVPIQQTLWRLWVPDEDVLLAFDRNFAKLQSWQAESTLRAMAADQPTAVAFKLPAEGRQLNFLRQGATDKLAVTTVRTELFAVVVWATIIASGVVMLKLGGFARSLIVLAAVLLAAVTGLFVPLFVQQILRVGWFAAAVVALLWLAHWVFLRHKRQSPPLAATGATEGTQQTQQEQGRD